MKVKNTNNQMEGKKFKMTNRRKKLKKAVNNYILDQVNSQKVIVEARNESQESEASPRKQSPRVIDVNVMYRKRKKKKKPEDDSSFDATTHNAQYKRKFRPSRGCIEFCKQKGCKIFLGMILMVSLFLTGLVSYNLWIKREDTRTSVNSFKTHLKYMNKDTENLTKWNQDLNSSLEFMIGDNEVLKKLEKEYGAKD